MITPIQPAETVATNEADVNATIGQFSQLAVWTVIVVGVVSVFIAVTAIIALKNSIPSEHLKTGLENTALAGVDALETALKPMIEKALKSSTVWDDVIARATSDILVALREVIQGDGNADDAEPVRKQKETV